MSSETEKIEAHILRVERRLEEALKANLPSLAVEIQKQILILQEDLENERQRPEKKRRHERQLELSPAVVPPVAPSQASSRSGRKE
jgi:hypothetical protein